MLAKWVPQNGGMQRSSSSLVPAVDGLFDEAFSIFKNPIFGDRAFLENWSATMLAPPTDIVETENELQVSVDLPGHDPQSLNVKVEGDTLTIQAERRPKGPEKGCTYLRNERGHGLYARSFVLPQSVNGSRCEARYEHGVLTLTLPKREEARPRTVEIKVSS
jgi:HSP20 family protein